LLDGIKKEAGKVIETKISINNDFSQQLNKISFISKLLLKSKLINSKEVVINRGNSLDIITDLIEEYLGKYKAIYVSGTSSQSSFRLLFIDGDLKGVYVNLNGEEHFGEKSLNSLEGEFKVNVYVILVPKLLGALDENP
jgi:nitrogenase molybdenum-iron protein alpha/beta subunit